MSEINTRAVISAVWGLHGGAGSWPTADRIAQYLEVQVDDVRPLLRELKTARIFRDRRRSNQVVWGPWDPAEFERP